MKCLNCKKTAIEFGAELEKGSYALKPGTSHLIEHDGVDSFVRCPHCKAKNVLIDAPTKPGQPGKQYFSHFKFD